MTVWNKRYTLDILLGSLIILIPFTLSSHMLFSDKDGQSSLNILGIILNHGCINNRVFVWAILIRLIPITLFLIWFLTCHFGWRYFIFLPLAPFASSISEPFISSTPNFIQYIIPLFIIVISALVIDYHINSNYLIAHRTRRSIHINQRTKRFYLRIVGFLDSLGINQSKNTDKIRIQNLENIKSILNKKYISHWLPDKNIRISKKSTMAIISLLIVTSLFFYVYELIPIEQPLLDLGIVSINNHDFPDLPTFIWYNNIKLCILLPLCLWFITCADWWRYAILCPIIIFTFQIWEAWQSDIIFVDESEYFQALPLILILISVLFYLSESIRYQSKILDTYDEVCEQIETLLEQSGNLDHVTQNNILKFNKLKAKRSAEGSDKVHLEALHKFKEELLSDLENTNFQLQERNKAWKAL